MKLLHLYHDIMNLYGEYANVLAAERALQQKGIDCTVDRLSFPEELSLNGALAAGKDDAVDPGEILRLSYFHCVGPEGAEHMLVLDKCSLNCQYTNPHLTVPVLPL